MITPADSSSQEAVGSQDEVGSGSSAAADQEITDEDLKKYAVMMDSVESMKQSLLSEISTKIKSNGNMKVARYNQLSKAIDDETKLAELKATPEEIAFIKEVAEMKNEGAQEISQQVETLATDYVGAEKYNKIKNSLPVDTELKMRYDAIASEVESKDQASAKPAN